MIYCRHCGASNVDYATFCTSCGKSLKIPPEEGTTPQPGQKGAPAGQPTDVRAPEGGPEQAQGQPPTYAPPPYAPPPGYAPPPYSQPQPPRPAVRNYLVEAIIVTVCCCWPLGIPAIIFAAQVNSKIAMGDFAAAESASNNARLFCIISLVLGIIGGVLYTIINAAAFMSAMSTGGFK